jgi:hypothetical protein
MSFKAMGDDELRRELKKLAREMLLEGRRTVVRARGPAAVEAIAARVVESMLVVVEELPAARRLWALALMAEEIVADRLRATSRVSPGERRN